MSIILLYVCVGVCVHILTCTVYKHKYVYIQYTQSHRDTVGYIYINIII